MHRRATVLILALIMIVPVIPANAQQPGHEYLNSVLWIQTAAEYAANARQTYHWASLSLKKGLQDKHWTAALEQTGAFEDLPPAVILDLDETVLDNSSFQAGLIKEGQPFSEAAWQQWVAEKKAELVPGALEFILDAHMQGVALFYVTNRVCQSGQPEDATRSLLQSLGIPQADLQSHLLCRTGDSNDKGSRRARLAGTHRILLLFGDDLGDFFSVPLDQATVEGRRKIFQTHAALWGERWFVLPNPMYGSWERAIGSDPKKKMEALRP